MVTPTPTHCRPRAFAFFAAQIPGLETDDALERAATAIAMHELAAVEPEDVDAQLDALARRVDAKNPDASVKARLALLHQVLFDEEGFTGNTESYYLPENSYLPAVLGNRLGIPITLALLYKAVGRRLGLRILGVNAPGHFLAAVDDADGQPMLVDPFHGGRVLSPDEAGTFIARLLGRRLPYDPVLLPRCTHRQWIGRMLGNLEAVFANQDRVDDERAMAELRALLGPDRGSRERCG